MKGWGGAVKWLAIFGCLLIVGFFLRSCEPLGWLKSSLHTVKQTAKDLTGHIPINDPKRPLKEVTKEDEIRALAAICLVDSAGEEKPAVRQKACVRAMEAALRYRAKYGNNLDEIFRLALTLYPRDRVTPEGWAERSVDFVFRPTLFLGYRKAKRVSTLELAKSLFEGPVPPGCATQYVRASRTTTEWYDEKAGAEKLKATMHEVPESDPDIVMRSYCP
jgi:hypothetical protein